MARLGLRGLFVFIGGAGVRADVGVSLSVVAVLPLKGYFRFIVHDVKQSTTIFFICEINAFIIRSLITFTYSFRKPNCLSSINN